MEYKNFKYNSYQQEVDCSEMNGLVFNSVTGLEKGSCEVIFTTECGRQFKMHHEQDCCETVDVDDICGDVSDLVGAIVIHFEERTNSGDEDSHDKPSEDAESFTWTFYDIQTTKGSVNIKWLGESNGYYSESVTIDEGVKI